MLKRILAGIILFAMFAIVIMNIIGNEKASSNERVSKDNSEFNGVAIAYPEGKEVAASVKVNEKAPDFTLETLNGDTLTLSELKGKYVFLNFWATWCTYCVDEMPAMQKFYEEHKDEVVIIGLNATGSEMSVDKVKKFVNELNITFPIVLDKDLELTYNIYKTFALPTTFFIDREGIIKIPKRIGPMDLEMMEEKLKELNKGE